MTDAQIAKHVLHLLRLHLKIKGADHRVSMCENPDGSVTAVIPGDVWAYMSALEETTPFLAQFYLDTIEQNKARKAVGGV